MKRSVVYVFKKRTFGTTLGKKIFFSTVVVCSRSKYVSHSIDRISASGCRIENPRRAPSYTSKDQDLAMNLASLKPYVVLSSGFFGLSETSRDLRIVTEPLGMPKISIIVKNLAEHIR